MARTHSHLFSKSRAQSGARATRCLGYFRERSERKGRQRATAKRNGWRVSPRPDLFSASDLMQVGQRWSRLTSLPPPYVCPSAPPWWNRRARMDHCRPFPFLSTAPVAGGGRPLPPLPLEPVARDGQTSPTSSHRTGRALSAPIVLQGPPALWHTPHAVEVGAAPHSPGHAGQKPSECIERSFSLVCPSELAAPIASIPSSHALPSALAPPLAVAVDRGSWRVVQRLQQSHCLLHPGCQAGEGDEELPADIGTALRSYFAAFLPVRIGCDWTRSSKDKVFDTQRPPARRCVTKFPPRPRGDTPHASFLGTHRGALACGIRCQISRLESGFFRTRASGKVFFSYRWGSADPCMVSGSRVCFMGKFVRHRRGCVCVCVRAC